MTVSHSAFFAVVHGIVQGVGFRYYTRKTAAQLHLRGTVRNLPSGEVEIFAEGAPDDLSRLAEWLKRGPSLSRVSKVDLRWTDPTGRYGDFHIIE